MGRAGLQGVHSVLTFDEDGHTVWPQEEGEWRPKRQPTWSPDKNAEPLPPAKFDFKGYEMLLLVAFAKCHRGEATLKQLPMIPIQMAELILHYGGLTDWINFDEHRLKRFWRIVREQSQPRRIPVSMPNKARRR